MKNNKQTTKMWATFAVVGLAGTLAAYIGLSSLNESSIKKGSNFLNEIDDQMKLVDEEFMNFASRFNRQYQSNSEFAERKGIFKQNWDKIKEINTNKEFGPHVELDINQFADMTDNEFQEKMLGFKPSDFELYDPE